MFLHSQHLKKFVELERIVRQVLAHLDVLFHREVGYQVVQLEDEADVPASVLGKIVPRSACDLLASHLDAALIGLVEAADAVEEG